MTPDVVRLSPVTRSVMEERWFLHTGADGRQILETDAQEVRKEILVTTEGYLLQAFSRAQGPFEEFRSGRLVDVERHLLLGECQGLRGKRWMPRLKPMATSASALPEGVEVSPDRSRLGVLTGGGRMRWSDEEGSHTIWCSGVNLLPEFARSLPLGLAQLPEVLLSEDPRPIFPRPGPRARRDAELRRAAAVRRRREAERWVAARRQAAQGDRPSESAESAAWLRWLRRRPPY